MEGEIREIPVEPIRDNDHAKITANEWCLKNAGWGWTGQWNNRIPGKMAIIMVVKLPAQGKSNPLEQLPPPLRRRMIEVPHITDEKDANAKAHSWMT